MWHKKHFQLLTIVCLLISLSACAQITSNTGTLNNTSMDTIYKTNEEWKKLLAPEQYYILREKGTERPYTGELLHTKESGTYHCSACGNPLFSSEAKFDSHCGWPSFDKELKKEAVLTAQDNSHGMSRTEIMCAHCGGHLGHVFPDGPTETGLRYCVNSVSLTFIANKK